MNSLHPLSCLGVKMDEASRIIDERTIPKFLILRFLNANRFGISNMKHSLFFLFVVVGMTIFSCQKKGVDDVTDASGVPVVLSSVLYNYEKATLDSTRSYTLAKLEMKDAYLYTLGNFVNQLLVVHAYIYENKSTHEKTVSLVSENGNSMLIYLVDALGNASSQALRIDRNITVSDSFLLNVLSLDWETFEAYVTKGDISVSQSFKTGGASAVGSFKTSDYGDDDILKDIASDLKPLAVVADGKKSIWLMSVGEAFGVGVTNLRKSMEANVKQRQDAQKLIAAAKEKEKVLEYTEAQDQSAAIVNKNKVNLSTLWKKLVKVYNDYSLYYVIGKDSCVGAAELNIGCSQSGDMRTLSFMVKTKLFKNVVANKSILIYIPSHDDGSIPSHLSNIDLDEFYTALTIKTNSLGIATVEWYPGPAAEQKVYATLNSAAAEISKGVTVTAKRGAIEVLTCPTEMSRILNLTGWKVTSINVKNNLGNVLYDGTGYWSNYLSPCVGSGVYQLTTEQSVRHLEFQNATLKPYFGDWTSYDYRVDCSVYKIKNFSWAYDRGGLDSPNPVGDGIDPTYSMYDSYYDSGLRILYHNTSDPNYNYTVVFNALTENYGKIKMNVNYGTFSEIYLFEIAR
jgi:hypothetical protein